MNWAFVSWNQPWSPSDACLGWFVLAGPPGGLAQVNWPFVSRNELVSEHADEGEERKSTQ